MNLFKKKTPKIEYTFKDFCDKQIALYQSLADNEPAGKETALYESMIARYTTMKSEYQRYRHEVEYMERKQKYEG